MRALLDLHVRSCLRSPTPTHHRRRQVTAEGVSVSEPFALDTKWDYALFRDPSANAVGTW